MKIGFDALALLSPKFPVKKFVAEIPSGVPIGVLDTSFGTNLKNLETVLTSGKVVAVRVQLINAVCCRNTNCCSPDFKGNSKDLEKAILAGKLDARIRQRVAAYYELNTHYPQVQFYISPLLEHNQSEAAYKHVADLVKEVWPYVWLVNNPHSGWKGSYRGSIRETHSADSKGKCSSLDGHKKGKGILGMNSSERNAWRKATRKHEYVLSWCNELNLRASGPRVCPLKRKDNLSRKMKEVVTKTYR